MKNSYKIYLGALTILLTTIQSMFDFYLQTMSRFSIRDKRLVEILEVEITKIDCFYFKHIFVLTIRLR